MTKELLLSHFKCLHSILKFGHEKNLLKNKLILSGQRPKYLSAQLRMSHPSTSPLSHSHPRLREHLQGELVDGEENYEMLTSRHDMAIALTNLQLLCYLHKILPAKIPARMRRSTPNIMPNLSRGATDNL